MRIFIMGLRIIRSQIAPASKFLTSQFRYGEKLVTDINHYFPAVTLVLQPSLVATLTWLLCKFTS